MARQEEDREDLMAEAKGLAQRAELALPEFAEPIVLGRKVNGCLSIYISGDLVYHFNSQGELRRAYVQGRLIKAERGQLVAMQRHRTDSEVQLLSQLLNPKQQEELLTQCSTWLQRIIAPLAAAQDVLLRRAPEDLTSDELQRWLAHISRPLVVATRPHAS